MSIPSQLPQIVAAARSGALQVLALQAGQMLDGKVIGPAPNGGTQVQIGGQMLNLVLPLLAKAGDTLKFEVQGSGAQMRLALQPATPQGASAPAASPAPLPPPSQSLPLPPQQSAPAAQSAQVTGPPPSPALAAPPPATPSPAGVPSPLPRQAAAVQVASPGQPPTTQVQVPATGTAPDALPAGATPQPATIAALPNASAPATPAPTAPAQPGPPVTQTTVAAPPAVAAAPPAPPPSQLYPVIAPRVTALPPLSSPVPTPPVPTGLPGTSTTIPSLATPMPAALPVSAPMPTTPQAAVAQMVQTALPRQDSITGLTAALTSIAGKVALPEPVVRAAQQVLAGRVSIDGGKLDAAALQSAIMRSGVFQEAGLARVGTPLSAPQADMKSALLILRQTLTAWLGQQAPLAQTAQVPPPIRGHIPRARAGDAPAAIDPRAAPEDIGKHLLERTEAALSRIRLHQSASLPDPVGKTADWSMDLPVLIGQHQTTLQMQIHRDEQNPGETTTERGWQMRFAINLPNMGEVGAQISLRGGTTGVMLWAAERSTSEALEAGAASLRDTLAGVGLRPGAVIVRHGEPPAPPPAPSGHFVDAST